MAAFILDASVAAAWCFTEEATPYTEAVLAALSVGDEARVPRLWAYELRNVVLNGFRKRRIERQDAYRFLQSLGEFRLRLVDPASYDNLLTLAERHNLTVYDAAYLDLAIREQLPLATLDRALIRAARNRSVDLRRVRCGGSVAYR